MTSASQIPATAEAPRRAITATSRETAPVAAPNVPRVWVLVDDRPGSTSQSTGLAQALDWPFEVKRVRFGAAAVLHNRLLDLRGGSRAAVDAPRSSPLTPPWPDLVIAAGRRLAPVAQWVRKAGGGRPRLVHLGRKGGDDVERFDLVVTPRYARLFPHPRRLVISAPLHGIRRERLEAATRLWKPTFERLPGPRIAVLVGGTSGQYWLDRRGAAEMGRAVAAYAETRGATLMVTTSRRTGAANTRAFCEALPPGSFVHPWNDALPESAVRDAEAENPYLGMLGWADEVIATGDSESMLAEALAAGRPLHIYPLPVRASFPGLRIAREWVRRRADDPATPSPDGRSSRSRRAIELGWVRPTRDLDTLHAALIERGLAVRFGDAPVAPATDLAAELEAVVTRVRSLLGEPATP